MKYNNNTFSANKKSVLIRFGAVILIAVLGLVLLALIVPYSNKAVKSMTINEVVATATLFISLGTIVIKISENVLRRSFTAKRKISIDTRTQGEYAVVTCRIENCSKGCIENTIRDFRKGTQSWKQIYSILHIYRTGLSG